MLTLINNKSSSNINFNKMIEDNNLIVCMNHLKRTKFLKIKKKKKNNK